MTLSSILQTTIFTSLFLAAIPLYAQKAHRDLRMGDGAYRLEDFAEAEENYRRAEVRQPGLQSWYNLGNALYRQERYEEAAGYYKKSAEAAADPALRARALHNLGNAQFQQGKLPEAIDAYKQALRNNPNDAGTRQNLAMALQQRAESEGQEANGQNSKGQEANGKEQRAEGEGANGQNSKGQGANGKEQMERNDIPMTKEIGRADGAKRHPDDEGNRESGEANGQPAPENNPQPSIPRSEAEKLLQIMEREEQKVQQRLRRATSTPPKSSKDW
ncbi:MAG: tetratricopeptide repeat protein [Saprospiraceae bacterium]|nr:tetratricopeptide repeat protein [Saprospiraceae bacterium]